MNKIQLAVTTFVVLAAIAVIFLSSCTSAKKITIPLDSKVSFEDTYTIIWNGYSKAFVHQDGGWQRAETFDYYFDVIQKRFDKEWKSVKSLHRIHPKYNGKAGKRDQTMYFSVNYENLQNSIVNGKIFSSLGNGILKTDNEFRNSTMDIDIKGANMFMPYNKIRITQLYDYEKGKLTETVILLKLKNGKETLFMKNEEEAYFYIKGKLEKAPTKFE
jgi:hypothetical protein